MGQGLVEEITGCASFAAADAEPPNLRNSGDGAIDQADPGSSALEREQGATLVNNTRDMLEQATHALGGSRRAPSARAVVRRGDRQGRVMAFPRATLCVACKQREDREPRARST